MSSSPPPPPLPVNSKPFRSAVSLQTVRPTARSVLRNTTTTTDESGGGGDASEARYWAEKFGLGHRKNNHRSAQFAHPRSATLHVGSAAVVHQIVIGSTSTAAKGYNYRNNGKQNLLAAVCGPRVPLYGITPQSALHRALSQHGHHNHSKRSSSSSSSATTAAAANLVAVEPDRQVPTGGQLALSASLRADGRLLAIGTDAGVIRIADTTTRATLCQFLGQTSATTAKLPVRAVHWFRDGQHVLSAGDDAVVRVWRLKGQQQQQQQNASVVGSNNNNNNRAAVVELKGHGDAIRCAVLWQKRLMNEQQQQRQWPCHAIAATGSYDHTVRLWNMEGLDDGDDDENSTRTKVAAAAVADQEDHRRCLAVLSHGAPVEALAWIDSTNPAVPIWLVSAGGTTLRVWNPVSGACVCTLQARHRKTVTSLLCLPRIKQGDSGGETTKRVLAASMRLVTAGLDGLLRIHAHDPHTGQLRFVHGVRITNSGGNDNNKNDNDGDVAITALAATFTGDRIAIGTAAGTVLVRQMGPAVVQRKRGSEPTAGTFAFFNRGMNVDAGAGDHVVGGAAAANSSKRRKLAKFDLALKQFRYGDALDEALETRIPQAVVAVLEELGKRRGLTIALSNRDEESLEPILAFTVRYVTRPRFSALLIGVANKLIDIYAEVAGQSETIDELFAKLKNQVTEEVRTQKTLFRVVGQIDAILAQAEIDQRDY